MNTYFPPTFPDIGGWNFERTWNKRKKWCKFSQTWTTSTGLFKLFQEFVRKKIKEEENESGSK